MTKYIAIIETPQGIRKAVTVKAKDFDRALEKIYQKGLLLSDVFFKDEKDA
jgi:hypothetical protein